jgi:hypothetical protein
VTDSIKLNIKGGLGNQIFGLAAGWSVAAETGRNLIVDGRNIGWQGSNRERTLELNLFDWSTFPGKLFFIQTKKVKNFGRRGNQISTHLRQKLQSKNLTLEKRDSPRDFFKIVQSAVSGYTLDGNYIDFEWLELARKYGFPTRFRLLGRFDCIVNEDRDTAVHVRLGDFLHFPDIFPIASPQFYSRSLGILESDKYDVFTDDLEMASKMFPDLLSGAEKIIGPEVFSGPETFVLLGAYPKIVTSSSTFSSIAAWGVDLNGGKVVCPEKMLISETFDSRPTGWVRIGN